MINGGDNWPLSEQGASGKEEGGGVLHHSFDLYYCARALRSSLEYPELGAGRVPFLIFFILRPTYLPTRIALYENVYEMPLRLCC